MCLPSEPLEDYNNSLEEESIKMICYAIDHGVNYVDTAYPYHAGKSEGIVGKALKDGYREKVKLVTKMPCWLIEGYKDFDKILNLQLERLQVEHIDYYLLHAVWKDRWEKMKKMKVFDWAEKAITDGKIGKLGFSFYDDFELFKEIIEGYGDWGLCQIQYNFFKKSFLF